MTKRLGPFLAGSAVLLFASPALASFHLMKIEQAMGGVGCDTAQQVVQLRMRFVGQNLVGSASARLIAHDAAGLNPVTLIVFPTNPPNGGQGDRILVVSPAFAAAHPTVAADFTMTSVIPPGYLAAGRLTFEDSLGTILWSLAWGGGGYTGSNTGSITNDADGNFGPPFGGALPSTTTQALRFSAADPTGAAPSTSNAADYSVTAGPAVLTNNAGASFTLSAPTADLSITKTDGQATAAPSQAITYTIVASNAGPACVTGATVSDTPPASLTGVTWTCSGSGGGTCAPAGANTINDTVNLPVGATVTYMLSGTVSATPSSLRNTATISAPAGTSDPVPGNNSATDSDLVVCGETVVVPDGRVTAHTLVATALFGASLKIGNSYSVEAKKATGDTTPLGTLTMFSGDDGCNVPTLVTRDTSGIDPAAGPGGARVSFTATGVETYFRARLAGAPADFTLTWSDTAMFSPAWSTFGSFDTFYSFQNTTGAALSVTLTLFDTAGAMVSTATLPIPSGQTASANTATLGTPRNRTGTARLTHDGPPGAVVAEAAVANFSISPAYVQPVKFQAVREAR